jgi:predicted amidohydrolase YtcJ
MTAMNPTVLTNTNVITCDPLNTVASALAIADDRIIAVGDQRSVMRKAGANATKIDLQGATVLPGLIDTHPHLMHFGALAEPLVDITAATSHTDITSRIALRASEAAADDDWILTTPVGEPHYFIRRSYRDLPEGDLPDRSVLDRAAPDHPVFIQAWAPAVPNVCAMNTLALHRLGITSATPDRVDNVWIEKDAAGHPTGRLRGSVTNYYCESPFMNDLLRQLPLLQVEAIVPGTERAMRAANATGITTVYEAHLMTFSLIELYRWLRSEDRLTLRVLCAPEAEPVGVPWSDPLQPADYRQRLERAAELVDRSDDLFRVDGVTVSPYGPCWPGFTLMLDEYRNPYGEGTKGVTMVSPEKVDEAIRFCHDHGVRLNIVASGLAELDSHLDQLEALSEAPLAADGRAWLLQHFYFAPPSLVRRAAALGLDVTTTMSFSWGKGEIIRERFGEHLLPDFIPLARLLDAGLHVAAGTDWGPKNVFEHIALAVDPRYAASRRQAATPGISRAQALAMWTSDAAHVLRWDGIGSLESGHHADLVVVDRDPLGCPTADLPGTQVISTLLGGRTVAGDDLGAGTPINGGSPTRPPR